LFVQHLAYELSDFRRRACSCGIGDLPIVSTSSRSESRVTSLKLALISRIAKPCARFEQLRVDVLNRADHHAARRLCGDPMHHVDMDLPRGDRQRDAIVRTDAVRIDFRDVARLKACERCLRDRFERFSLLGGALCDARLPLQMPARKCANDSVRKGNRGQLSAQREIRRAFLTAFGRRRGAEN
jgi:hypothetical protein